MTNGFVSTTSEPIQYSGFPLINDCGCTFSGVSAKFGDLYTCIDEHYKPVMQTQSSKVIYIEQGNYCLSKVIYIEQDNYYICANQ